LRDRGRREDVAKGQAGRLGELAAEGINLVKGRWGVMLSHGGPPREQGGVTPCIMARRPARANPKEKKRLRTF
jgi:hypothetical protein